VTWSPTPRVRDTFVRVFPHVLEVGDTLVGSDARIEVDRAVLRQRMNEWFAAQHYARGRVQIEGLIEDAFKRPIRIVGPAEDRSRSRDVNTDLFPKDELLASRRCGGGSEAAIARRRVIPHLPHRLRCQEGSGQQHEAST